MYIYKLPEIKNKMSFYNYIAMLFQRNNWNRLIIEIKGVSQFFIFCMFDSSTPYTSSGFQNDDFAGQPSRKCHKWNILELFAILASLDIIH